METYAKNSFTYATLVSVAYNKKEQRSPIINEDPINKYDGGIIIKNTTTTLESHELFINVFTQYIYSF